jgi:hypothetical protein
MKVQKFWPKKIRGNGIFCKMFGLIFFGAFAVDSRIKAHSLSQVAIRGSNGFLTDNESRRYVTIAEVEGDVNASNAESVRMEGYTLRQRRVVMNVVVKERDAMTDRSM